VSWRALAGKTRGAVVRNKRQATPLFIGFTNCGTVLYPVDAALKPLPMTVDTMKFLSLKELNDLMDQTV